MNPNVVFTSPVRPLCLVHSIIVSSRFALFVFHTYTPSGHGNAGLNPVFTSVSLSLKTEFLRIRLLRSDSDRIISSAIYPFELTLILNSTRTPLQLIPARNAEINKPSLTFEKKKKNGSFVSAVTTDPFSSVLEA